MGQRHQAFIIARVVPRGQRQPRYRCIGAIHHQWCYGRLPLRAAARFMTLIKQKDNAEVIREEISAIHGLYGQFRKDPEISEVPCPFTHFLLSSAWSTDLSDPEEYYGSTLLTLPAGMGSKEGDNNDGITIIDVTDPEHPSYCFVSTRGLEGENNDVPLASPLSATQYVRAYYPRPRISHESQADENENPGSEREMSSAQRERLVEKSVQATLQLIDSFPVMSKAKLAEAWPVEYRLPNDANEEETPSDTCISQLPSLVDLTLRPAVEQAILNDDIEKLEPLILHPDKASVMGEIIRSQKHIPEAGVSLLKTIINVHRNKALDLSGFDLSGEQILGLLLQEQDNQVLKLDIEVLKLSHNDRVNIDVVQQVLELPSLPALRRLVLWNTAVRDADIIGLLGKRPDLFYRLEGLIHPAFMKQPTQAIFLPAFTHLSCRYSDIAKASLPYFTSGQIAQGLMDYLAQLNSDNPLHSHMAMGYGNCAMAAYASEVRPTGRSWADRIVPFVPSSSLNEPKAGQWVFGLSPLHFTRGNNSEATTQYAFARPNVQALQEMKDGIDKIQSGTEATKEQINEQISAVREKYGSCLYDIYDVRAFFKELELEGRPAPEPDALARLFDLFSSLSDSDREGSGALKLMTADYFIQFLNHVHLEDHMRQMFMNQRW